MKRNLFLLALTLLAGSLVAADTTPKDDVIAAARKLSETSAYSWTSTTEVAGGNNRGGGPVEGKTDNAGYSLITLKRADNTIEAVIKDGKAAVKITDGWQTPTEIADAAAAGGLGENRNPGRMIARLVQAVRPPAVQAAELAGKAKDIKKAGDAYESDLDEATVKEMLSLGRRREGGDGPTVTGAKGSVRFWLKEGVLSKMELKTKGTVSFNGNDREMDRTITVEVKDVGTTKLEIPEEAKKKVS